MNKYAPLEQYLKATNQHSIILRFIQVEQILGAALPPSSYKYAAWWANGGHAHAGSWLDAGFTVEQVDFKAHVVAFIRK